MHQIASGGGASPAPLETEEALLPPGERGEFLIRPRRAGEFRICDLPYIRSGMGSGMGMGMARRRQTRTLRKSSPFSAPPATRLPAFRFLRACFPSRRFPAPPDSARSRSVKVWG
jgi:FtsP/CotA-like multicopper oxidase with cupredoxin domain